MPSTPRNRLGDLERAVMEELWTTHETHPDGLTVRDRMSKKGLVERERDGRAWRYTAASSRAELTSEALHHTLGELAGDTRRMALLHFLDESTPEEIDELRAALAELEARGAGDSRAPSSA